MSLEEIVSFFEIQMDDLFQECISLRETASQFNEQKFDTVSVHSTSFHVLEKRFEMVQNRHIALYNDLSSLRLILNRMSSNDVSTTDHKWNKNVSWEMQSLTSGNTCNDENSDGTRNSYLNGSSDSLRSQLNRFSNDIHIHPLLLNQDEEPSHNQIMLINYRTQEAPRIDLKLSGYLQSRLNTHCTKSNENDASDISDLYSGNAFDGSICDAKIDNGITKSPIPDLQMDQSPNTVAELYEQLITISLPRLRSFQKKFGKVQVNKIPSIRTFQRRKALLVEINNFSLIHNRTIIDSIKFFEKYRLDREKTVAWLYSNIDELQGHFFMK
ncbi:hypothetical protein HG535_0A04630 [Zygotorulaspora mrakii]|uniref:Transcription activator GCR1-like domain-containing protein n=1 Tax=Zygotorulaspora mrakii TaxID=42260 RepID=A0A7H9AWC0_ZYGMR|nr:uncharacterized protein HG535_0A04630 [Zygotorulaspora mrakii]QLG70523.1 hypothetical protein HG535_0A04630 [Zygotorulaspora mrakii]